MDLSFGAFAVICLIPCATCAVANCVEGCVTSTPSPNRTVEDGVKDDDVVFPPLIPQKSITAHSTTEAPIPNTEPFMEDLYPTTSTAVTYTTRPETRTTTTGSSVAIITTTTNMINTCPLPCRQTFQTCLNSGERYYCGCEAGYFKIAESKDGFQCVKPVLLKQKFGFLYKDEYANTSSPEFRRIAENVTKILTNVYAEITSTVNVTKITQGSVVVWYETVPSNGREFSQKDIQILHTKAVKKKNYGLGNISIGAPEIVTASETCLPDTITNGSLVWNFDESKPGDWVRSKENCDGNNEFTATIRCINRSDGARYDQTTLKENSCSVTWNSVATYEDEGQLTEDSLTEIMTAVTTLSSKYEDSTTQDVDRFIDVYHDISQEVGENEIKVSELSMYNIIWATDNLRKAVYDTVVDRLEKAKRTKLIRSLGIFADNVALSQNLLYIESSSVKLVAQKVDGRSSLDFSDAPASDRTGDRRNITAHVPRSALGTPSNASRNAVFFLHEDTTLFPNSDEENSEMSEAGASGCSYTTQRCTFLNVETGNWKYGGCRTQYGDTPDYVKCSCNHATNFAVLVKTNNVKNSYLLDIVGKIGCILSIVGLLLTIFTYLYFRSLRKNKLNQVHLHLCASLLVGYLTFLAGVERPRHYAPCLVVTAILQFSFLSAWGWMITEFYVMYRKFIRVFEDIHGRFVFKASMLVYAVSLTTTAITFVVAYTVGDTVDGWIPSKNNDPLCWKSAYAGDRLCWLHSYALYFGFLVPVGIMFAINFVGFIVIMHKINRKRPNLGRQVGKDPELKDQLIRVFLISSLLGVTWMFAVPLTISEDEVVNEVFSWLFSIGNAFQGIIFFVLFCVRRNNVKQLWIDHFGVCCKHDIMKKSKSATSSTYDTGATLPSSAHSHSTIRVMKDEIDMGSLQSG